MSTELAEFLKDLTAECAKYEPCMGLRVDQEGQSVELFLGNGDNWYGEHIRGEGADICLYRDMDTDRVLGIRLPLYNDKLSVFHDGPLKINEGFRREGA